MEFRDIRKLIEWRSDAITAHESQTSHRQTEQDEKVGSLEGVTWLTSNLRGGVTAVTPTASLVCCLAMWSVVFVSLKIDAVQGPKTRQTFGSHDDFDLT